MAATVLCSSVFVSFLFVFVSQTRYILPGMTCWTFGRTHHKILPGEMCFYINERWCTDVTVLKKMSCSDIETLFINYKPFYSPREICSFIPVSVYNPLQAHVSSALQKLADLITDTEQKHPDSVLIILEDFNKVISPVNCQNTDSTSHVPPKTVIYWITVIQRQRKHITLSHE